MYLAARIRNVDPSRHPEQNSTKVLLGLRLEGLRKFRYLNLEGYEEQARV